MGRAGTLEDGVTFTMSPRARLACAYASFTFSQRSPSPSANACAATGTSAPRIDNQSDLTHDEKIFLQRCWHLSIQITHPFSGYMSSN